MSNAKGLELRLARIRRGLHLYEVARALGISPARLSQFEGDHRRPPTELENKLRRFLGLPQKAGKGSGKG